MELPIISAEEAFGITKPSRGIAVDVGTSGNPGFTFYRLVDIETKEQLAYAEIGHATNNIGEFLALCHGIHYVLSNKLNLPIYSDSQTAISWVKKKKTNSKFDHPRLKTAEKYLESLKTVPIFAKWLTKEWGEIPADFNRK